MLVEEGFERIGHETRLLERREMSGVRNTHEARACDALGDVLGLGGRGRSIVLAHEHERRHTNAREVVADVVSTEQHGVDGVAERALIEPGDALDELRDERGIRAHGHGREEERHETARERLDGTDRTRDDGECAVPRELPRGIAACVGVAERKRANAARIAHREAHPDHAAPRETGDTRALDTDCIEHLAQGIRAVPERVVPAQWLRAAVPRRVDVDEAIPVREEADLRPPHAPVAEERVPEQHILALAQHFDEEPPHAGVHEHRGSRITTPEVPVDDRDHLTRSRPSGDGVAVTTRLRVAVALAALFTLVAIGATALDHLASRRPPQPAQPLTTRRASPGQAASAPAEAATAPAGTAREEAATAPPTVLWLTGDVLLDPAFRRSGAASGDPAEAYAAMIAPVAKHWRADGESATVIVNLESPVATTRREPDSYLANAEEIFARTGHRRVPSPLNAPPSLLDALMRMGVDGVDLANNHALDQNREGLGETLDAAHASGLATLGGGRTDEEARAVRSYGAPGARVGILATFVRDAPEPADLGLAVPRLNIVDERTLDDVRHAAETNDAVVVVVHVVAELLARPTPGTRALASDLVAAGADLVVVHGPHVIAPIERVESGGRAGLVAFSVGNFVSDMGKDARPGRRASAARNARDATEDKWHDARTRSGLVVRVSLAPGTALDVSFLPTWMHNDRWLIDHGLARPPITFTVEPVAACGPPLALRSAWPPEGDAAIEAWVAEERDAAIATAGLFSEECARCTPGAQCRWRGEAHLLRAR